MSRIGDLRRQTPLGARGAPGRILQFLASSLTYSLAGVLTGLSSFVLTVVLARFLTPADFGIYGLLIAVMGLLGPLMILNGHIMVQRRYPVLGEERLGALVRAIIRITRPVVVLALLIATILGVAGAFPDVPPWVLLVTAGCAALSGVETVAESVLIMRRQPRQLLLLRVLLVIASLTVSMVTVIVLGWDWRGRFVGQMVGVGAAGVAAILILRRVVTRTRETLERTEVVRFGGPLIPHTAGIWANNYLDRFFVAGLLSVSSAGIYVVAYSVSVAMDILHNGISMAFSPGSYTRLARDSEADRRAVGRAFYLYCGTSLLFFIAIAPVATLLVGPVLGPRFSEVSTLLPWLLLGQTLLGIARIGSLYLYATERTGLRAAITVASTVLGVIYTVSGILLAGLQGAAIATACTFATNAALTVWAGRRTGLLLGVRQTFRPA